MSWLPWKHSSEKDHGTHASFGFQIRDVGEFALSLLLQDVLIHSHFRLEPLWLWAQWPFTLYKLAQVFVTRHETNKHVCISAVKTLLRSYTALILLRLRCFQPLNEFLVVHTSYIINMMYQRSFFFKYLTSKLRGQSAYTFLHFSSWKKKSKRTRRKLNIFALCDPDFDYSNLCTSFVFNGGQCEMTCLLMWHDTRGRTALHRRHLLVN